jgi:23S rRNA (uracil1939-C5)-methyltransferase
LGKKNKPLPLLEKVEITDLAAEGKALAKVDELVVFVPWVAPGDIVDIQLTRKKSNYAEGRAVHFHKYSDIRVEPICEHFTVCGGCKWQHIPYSEQLKYKQKQVVDNLTRIGKVEIKSLIPISGSEETEFYRNKLEFTFSNKRWLTVDEIREDNSNIQLNGVGFHIPGMFDKVLDIKKCWLQNNISNKIRLFIKELCFLKGYSFFDLKKQEGFIRTIIVRTSLPGDNMIIVVFYEDDKEKREYLLNAIKKEFPEITSLMYVINRKCNDTITDQDVITYSGKDHLIEEMEDLKFKVGPKSFFQTNSRQAYKLYSLVRDFAGLTGNEIVYDLYTGTGTIANFVAHQSKKVVGIEYVPEAIEDAKINSQLNNLDNTSFYAGDMKDLLSKEFIEANGHPDVIITDPPRSGMHDDVTDMILEAEPERIVYVSCNPATQARDLSRLRTKYEVAKVQPVDMFPHTHHVENIALLIRNSNKDDS